jgi:hypothetical protein
VLIVQCALGVPFQPAGGDTALFTPAAGGLSGEPNFASWGAFIGLLLSVPPGDLGHDVAEKVPDGRGARLFEPEKVATDQSPLYEYAMGRRAL